MSIYGVKDLERRRSACHEGGHALVAHHLGWLVAEVELDPPRCSFVPRRGLDPLRRVLESTLITEAGHAAERLIVGPLTAEEREARKEGIDLSRYLDMLDRGEREFQVQAAHAGPESDAGLVESDLVTLCGGDEDEAQACWWWLRRRADRLVEELRDPIALLADALLEGGRLDRVDVALVAFGAEDEREAVA